MNVQDEKLLLKLARKSIESKFSDKKHIFDSILNEVSHLNKKQGVFVTLHKKGELRGCIGIPEPVMPLGDAIINAAKSAAFHDSRFPAVTQDEIKEIKIEISVLTVPKKLSVEKPDDLLDKIHIGKDGLIIRSIYGSGLLLPQVAAQQGWNTTEFLEYLCLKAGLPNNAWKENDIYIFQAEIFSEN